MPLYFHALKSKNNLSLPSAFSITLGLPDSMTATHELVVPRSIPTMLKQKESKGKPPRFQKKENSDGAYWDSSSRSCSIVSELESRRVYLREVSCGLGEERAVQGASLAFQKCSQHLLCVNEQSSY